MNADVEQNLATSETQEPHVALESPEVPADNHAGNLDMTLTKLADNTIVTNLDKAASFIESLPGYLGQTFGEYRKPLTTIGLFVGLAVGIAIANGILSVINTIPLMPPLLESVGLGYTGWFIWRYLVFDENRQDLLNDYQALKNRILGRTE